MSDDKPWFEQILDGVAGLAPHARAFVEALDELSKADFRQSDNDEIARLKIELATAQRKYDDLKLAVSRYSFNLSERILRDFGELAG